MQCPCRCPTPAPRSARSAPDQDVLPIIGAARRTHIIIPEATLQAVHIREDQIHLQDLMLPVAETDLIQAEAPAAILLLQEDTGQAPVQAILYHQAEARKGDRPIHPDHHLTAHLQEAADHPTAAADLLIHPDHHPDHPQDHHLRDRLPVHHPVVHQAEDN